MFIVFAASTDIIPTKGIQLTYIDKKKKIQYTVFITYLEHFLTFVSVSDNFTDSMNYQEFKLEYRCQKNTLK